MQRLKYLDSCITFLCIFFILHNLRRFTFFCEYFQISHQVLSDDGSLASPSTVVYETEETLEDGTVVKRKVTKTTEQHIEADDTL